MNRKAKTLGDAVLDRWKASYGPHKTTHDFKSGTLVPNKEVQPESDMVPSSHNLYRGPNETLD